MIDEIAMIAGLCDRGPRTIFVGGGTPTLLEPDLWRQLLDALRSAFDLSAVSEFTVEANPETVTTELTDVLAGGGVNRVSIGAQSFEARHLKTLERWHDPDNVARAVDVIRRGGIDNINLDLIFAIPGQTHDEWRTDLGHALAIRPDHLSCYALTYEPNTPMTAKLGRGRITRIDESLEADMFETTIDTLTAAGFEHYEVSNYALGRRDEGHGPDPAETDSEAASHSARYCQHNLIYWRNENWLAIGPSAAGHVNGLRWKNVPHLGQYLASCGAAPVQDVEQLDARARVGEHLMLRLRLLEGVPLDWIDQHVDAERCAIIDRHIADGLLQRTAAHVALTRRGLLLADSVISDLL